MTNESPTQAAQASHAAFAPAAAQDIAWMRNLLVIFCGSLFVAVCAHITLPLDFTPVPLTLQDFAVMALGLFLTPRLAMYTMLVYLAEGAAGLPVFAPGPMGMTGLAHILGPTGGYLMAYPTVAAVTSYLWRTSERSYLGALVSAGAGNMILLTLGGAWLGLLTHISPQAVMSEAVMPFVPGDAIKILLAAFVGSEWYRMGPAPRRPIQTVSPVDTQSFS